MVDTEGSVETARQRTDSTASAGENRKIDLIVRELDRYDVKVAALQETKWFGSEVYKVGESTVLTAGRPVPRAGSQVIEVRVWH